MQENTEYSVYEAPAVVEAGGYGDLTQGLPAGNNQDWFTARWF